MNNSEQVLMVLYFIIISIVSVVVGFYFLTYVHVLF